MAIKAQRITDLCIAINAVEGADCAPKYNKQNERVRNTLYDVMIKEAIRLHFKQKVGLGALSRALHEAGWEGQMFVNNGPTWGRPFLQIREA
mgnify:CR=1 FL=1